MSRLSAKMDVYAARLVLLSCLQAINNKLAERRYRRVYDRKANRCDTARVGKCCLEVSVDIPDIPTTCRIYEAICFTCLCCSAPVCKRRYSIIRDSAMSTDKMPIIRHSHKKVNGGKKLTLINKNLVDRLVNSKNVKVGIVRDVPFDRKARKDDNRYEGGMKIRLLCLYWMNRNRRIQNLLIKPA